MSVARYALVVLLVLAGSLGALWPALGDDERLAAMAGGALAGVNTVVAYGLVVWSASRSTVAFMRAVLGGMIGRLAVVLVAVVVAVLVLGLPRLPLIAALLAYFVLFLVFELAVVQQRASALSRRAEARRP